MIAAAVMFGGVATASAQTKETVKIAFIGPMSGGNSAAGIGGRNSAELAVRLRNADPASKYNYQLVPMDDECKPNVGIQVATRVSTDRSIVAGVTHYCSAVAIATVDVYHRFRLPVVVWGAILPAITYGNEHKEIHRVNGSMLDEVRASTSFLTGLGYKKWVIVHDTTDYGNGFLRFFKERIAETNAEIVSSFGVSADQQDFSAELLKIKGIQPQIVVFAGLTPLGVRIRSQMERLGVDIQYAGVSGIMSASYVEALGATAEGTVSVHNGAPAESLPGGRMFVEQYGKAGFTDPAEPYGPYAFVAASLIMDAVEEVGPDREKVRDVLNATKDHESVAGPITFDDHRHHAVASTKYVAQDGHWVRWEDSLYASGQRHLKGQ
ncbi:branched-chain amino acid ABC transporter substrate-binding protein [Aminobacter aganoensis]|nr:branched-chain amino acid ABC transporter substrate-binding protein [Aminobacter aganoensis]